MLIYRYLLLLALVVDVLVGVLVELALKVVGRLPWILTATLRCHEIPVLPSTQGPFGLIQKGHGHCILVVIALGSGYATLYSKFKEIMHDLLLFPGNLDNAP